MESLIREYVREELKIALKKKKKKARRDEIAATGLGASLTGMSGGIRAFWNTPPRMTLDGDED
jgi:hypothetical protein